MASKPVKLSELVNPTSRQEEFWQAIDSHQYTLYGGAAGGGKSYILRWTLIRLLLRWAAQGHTNVRVGLFCEDYPSLKDRHLSRIKIEFPDWLGKYREVDHEFTLDRRFGGGVICFRNLDDVSKYLSSEFAAIAVDELTRNTRDKFDFLRMRLRWPGIEETKFFGASNPGGPGHGWVKALWIDGIFPPEMQIIAKQFAFVPAFASDNPHLPTNYLDGLNTLPDALRKAYAEGSWDVFAGQVFTEWDRKKHVVTPFEIPDSWIKFRSMDWGYAKPFSIHWHAVDYDGVIYTYRELYGWNGTPDSGCQKTPAEVAKQLNKLDKGEKIAYSVADPACWSRGSGTGPTVAEEFYNKGVMWRKANNDRLQGLQQMHLRLKNETWKVFDSCMNLIRTLPTLVYDKHRVEDVDTTQEDHAYDDCRYALQSRPYRPERQEKSRYQDAWNDDEDGGIDWMKL